MDDDRFTDGIARDVAKIARIPAVSSILDVVCRTTGMGFAAVARVTEDRWVACSVKDDIAFGLAPGGELRVETTICNEIRERRESVIINDVDHSDFVDHHTPALYGFKSYISVPIVLPNGQFFGTLCAIDPQPARLENTEVVAMFELFAELIAFHIDAIDRMVASEADLSEEREMSALREQFIAVLGHDLRNPLAAIGAAVHTLGRETLSERGVSVIALTKGAVRRMSKLIDDVLDFARARMGDGLAVQRSPVPIEQIVHHVTAELQAAHPDSKIVSEIAPVGELLCDPDRLAQLFSNLIANAITHGCSASPIYVRAATQGETFEFSVENAGEPIATVAMDRLFSPFSRGDIKPSQQGLGLGLYIAAEVARAHDGAMTVVSTQESTRFTFRMPVVE